MIAFSRDCPLSDAYLVCCSLIKISSILATLQRHPTFGEAPVNTPKIVLSLEEHAELSRRVRSATISQRGGRRARALRWRLPKRHLPFCTECKEPLSVCVRQSHLARPEKAGHGVHLNLSGHHF